MSSAVFDQEAFYAFRSFVEGGISDPQKLRSIERFVRAVVLHDEMSIVLEPMPAHDEDDHEWTEEEIAQGGRNVIVAFGPTLQGYEELLSASWGPHPQVEIKLSPRLEEIAVAYSPPDPSSAFFKAHRRYLHELATVLAAGGSVICEGPLGRAGFDDQRLPESWLADLDREWAAFARAAEDGLEFLVPPVLAIVLSRASKRSHLLAIIRDLRQEWAEARQRTWSTIARLRAPASVKEAHDARRELAEAAKLFNPSHALPGLLPPLRVLWDIFASAAIGAAMGDAVVGAATAIGRGVLEGTMRHAPEAARHLLGNGAFDLARRINVELRELEPLRPLLARHLTETEKRNLGIN